MLHLLQGSNYIIFLIICSGCLPLLVWADFQIEQVEVHREQNAYLLDAVIRYDLTAVALEALDNGVPLTIVTHIQVRRARAWLWEENLVDLQMRQVIRYKPLAERYEVCLLPGTSGRAFVSRAAALHALGEINDLPLLEQNRLNPHKNYEIQIKVALDIEELPLPLRPIAYLRSSWQLDSGWTKWPFAP